MKDAKTTLSQEGVEVIEIRAMGTFYGEKLPFTAMVNSKTKFMLARVRGASSRH